MAHADSYGASASGTDSNGISFESSSKWYIRSNNVKKIFSI
jgi:hypothetical protein